MIKDTDYAYAVARLKANENKLLTSSDIEALISCRTLEQCFEFLSSKGWSVSEESTVAQALSQQNKELWVLLCESVPDKSVLNVLTALNDYFNLKAAVKASLTQSDPDRLFVYPTSLDLDLLKQAVKMREFSRLGEEAGKASDEAYKAALTSGSGQAADIIIDKAALDCLTRLSSESKSELVKDTARLICTFADIKTAYRSAKTNKSESFIDKALSCGG
ncbi:MAG: V-type ATPase subunit, partial [Acutalibacteraceae bacterium]